MKRRISALALVLIFFGANSGRADHYILILAVDAKAAGAADTIVASTKPVGAALAKVSRKLPGATHYHEILGAKATKEHVLAGLRWLERMTARDTAIVYIHMHGGHSAKNTFWLAPADYEDRHVRDTGILGEELRKAMTRLKGPSVLCVSSCHSGGLLLEPGAWGQCQVIVSCSATELSKRKIMDKAVIEAIEGKADANHDGVVSVREFRDYVERRIHDLRTDMHPTAHDNASTQRLSLGRL